MGNRIAVLLVLSAALIGGYYIYRHHEEQKIEAGGEVSWVTGKPTAEEHERFLKENSGETADGQSERKDQTARQADAAGFPSGTTTTSTPGAATTTAVATPAATTATTTSAAIPSNQVATPATESMSQPAVGTLAGGSMPVTDTLAPNAPNGMAFGGKGTYQWYRQGNLTWRLDTVSGRSCIVYATMEEWRKQIVMAHGCGRDA